jgi:hypothetical protein
LKVAAQQPANNFKTFKHPSNNFYMIQSIQDAFHVLDTQRLGIPFDAIEYLYEHPTDPAITEKIIFALKNAYNEDSYYDEADEFNMPTPLWYAIVAENHLSEALIEPAIELFCAENEDDWDFLNEQGEVLIGKLCEAYPDVAIPKILDTIERLAKQDSDAPYLYLSDFIYFIKSEEHKARLLEVYGIPTLDAVEIFSIKMAEMQIKEALPLVKEWHARFLEQAEEDILASIGLADLEEVIEELESGISKYPEHAKPQYLIRGDWKTHYAQFEGIFFQEDELFDDEDDDDEYYDDSDYLAPPDELNDLFAGDYIPYDHIPETFKREQPKIGRNDPCPCGSGKKFKKCHWGQGNYD